ncbi:GNAT family N-acetyltransferase [Endozoicomonas sp. ALB115]|uniref:GNAT family N-acetyltransferase n=1 Tax=Endozoicomonas sp. ALB115 TaxID=3403074 RepID=UPI003BB6AA87
MSVEFLDPAPIAGCHKLKNISSGDKAFLPLKNFLKQEALYLHDEDITKTYVACFNVADDDPQRHKVVGYVSFTNSEVCFKEATLPEGLQGLKYQSLPALKISRLMVCSKHRDKGLGRVLMDFAIWMAIETIRPWVGCRLLTVDSKPEAIEFYKRYGFEMIDTPDNLNSDCPVMYFDLRSAMEEDDAALPESSDGEGRKVVSKEQIPVEEPAPDH